MQFLEAYRDKSILYAVLNWGLGHASRSIPLIWELMASGNQVTIYSDGSALDLLRKELPTLDFVSGPAYDIRYTQSNIWLNILFNSHRINTAIKNEHEDLIRLMDKRSELDLIISDSRYGMYHPSVPSVVITHQVQIHSKIDWWGRLASSYHKNMLSKFNECWIIDNAYGLGAGKLSNSRGLKIPFKYIGLHSRMSHMELDVDYDICLVLSGPEPDRSKLELRLIEILEVLDYKVCLVRGSSITAAQSKVDRNKVDVFELLASHDLNKVICRSAMIICRSGYSSIMDLLQLKKKAILIPTRGQTEQEYLADYHGSSNQFITIKENRLTAKLLEDAIGQLLN